jgi:hypothetical protein
MNKHRITAALILAVCFTGPIGAAEPGLAEITPEAAASLETALADAKWAEAQRNLWTSVTAALNDAKRAAAAGDSAAVIRHAHAASEQAKLSIEQTRYPTVQ